MFTRRAASEFPNDNPELHDGLVWACAEPCDRPLPTLRMRAPQGELPKVLGPAWHEAAAAPVAGSNVGVRSEPTSEPSPAPVVVEAELAPEVPSTPEAPTVLEPEVCALDADDGAGVAPAAPAAEAPPPLPLAGTPDAAGPFFQFVATVARVAMQRGAMRGAAAVAALLTFGRLATQGLDPALVDGLARRRIIVPASGQTTPEFAAAVTAWRALLEGASADLSACGNATLDAWASELLAAALNASKTETSELRRELRRAGVAAFGLLAVA